MRTKLATSGAGDASRLFDAYAMVDWSSRKQPARGADSIWIGWGELRKGRLQRRAANYGSRSEAMAALRRKLAAWEAAGRRALVGFDFSLGYPRGYSVALGLNEKPAWQATLRHYGACVRDDIDGRPNRHNRDAFAAECNRVIAGGGPGPFWGCPASSATETLGTHRVGVFAYPYAGLAEFRLTEVRLRPRATPQSVWKISQGVAVGGQTIMGLKHVHDLRFQPPTLTGGVSIWPFETAWSVPASSQCIIAEIFPSLLPLQDHGGPRDKDQVMTCVQHAAALDAVGELVRQFARPETLSDSESSVVLEEEGWILFS